MNSLFSRSPKITRLKREVRNRFLSSTIEAELKILPFLVPRDKIAIDVGANVGVYTHVLIKLASSVIAIEANPSHAEHLRLTYGHRARIVNAAATNEKLQLMLRIPKLGSRSSGLATVAPENDLSGSAYSEVAVPGIPLSEIINNSGEIGFLKIDVEGHELAVLEGAVDVLRKDLPVILVEAEDRHRVGAVRSVNDFLKSLGYRGMIISNGLIKNFDIDQIERFQKLSDDEYAALDLGSRPKNYVNNFIFLA